jgi:hypothetical protein
MLKDGVMDVSQVIEAFGGYQKAQQALGVSRSLLARWEEEGIPAKRWTQIATVSRVLADRVFTVEELAAIVVTGRHVRPEGR